MDEPAAAELFDEALYTQSLAAFRSPPPMSVPALLTAVLVIAFAASAFGQLSSWTSVALLVAVVAFHEAGHAFGMRVFGFRDVKMFFIPFFGAAVVGRPRGAAPWKDALVSLLGPLPGLMLAVALFAACWYTPEPAEWMFHAAVTLMLLNAFNLLPLGFLDGGRFFQRALFARHRALEIGFEALGSLALGVIAVALKIYVLAFFVLVSLRGLPRRWRVLSGAAKFRAAHPHAPSDPEQLSDDDARGLYALVREAVRHPANEHPGAIAGAMEEMLDSSQRSPGFFATIGLVLLYVFAVFCTLTTFYFHVSSTGPEEPTLVRMGVCAAEFPRVPSVDGGARGTGARDSTWRALVNGVERFSAEKLDGDTSAAALEKRVEWLAKTTKLDMKRSLTVEGARASDSLVGTEFRFKGANRELRTRTFVVAGKRYWITASAPKLGERQERFLDSFRLADEPAPVVPE